MATVKLVREPNSWLVEMYSADVFASKLRFATEFEARQWTKEWGHTVEGEQVQAS